MCIRDRSGDEDRRLQKCGQTQADDLFAPLDEAIRITAGYRKHVQTSHSDLDQQDTAAFQIGEEDLDDRIRHKLSLIHIYDLPR